MIGKKHDEDAWDAPVCMGDNCSFGFGSWFTGKVNSSKNVTIGANSVVTKDIPDNVVCAGLPAKVLKYDV